MLNNYTIWQWKINTKNVMHYIIWEICIIIILKIINKLKNYIKVQLILTKIIINLI